jgi:hypothetical protein
VPAPPVEPTIVEPCVPSPCGPNSACQPVGDRAQCSCLPNMIGVVPNCRPECIINSDCPSSRACINMRCVDPCPGSCGPNTECRVIGHTPTCTCASGFTGNAFEGCQRIPVGESLESRRLLKIDRLTDSLLVTKVVPNVVEPEPRPCEPSPCGTNAECREQGNKAACFCPPDYIGDPFVGCRPECLLSADCPSSRACIRNKCVDPCPGLCGINAECRVANHIPVCSCQQGFTGDPYSSCRPIPVVGKSRVQHLHFVEIIFERGCGGRVDRLSDQRRNCVNNLMTESH